MKFVRRRFLAPLVVIVLSLLAPLVSLAEDVNPKGVVDLDIQGHRGCRGLRPENTLPAFERALELQVTTLEMDVHATRDRILVVHHDPRLNPKLCVRTDGSGLTATPFDKLDYADLSNVDCGARPNPKFPQQLPAPGARIPTLTEVLRLAASSDYPVRVSIEIKMQVKRTDLSTADLARLVVESVEQHGLESRTIIQSFDAAALAAVRELAPEIPRAYLVRDRNYQKQIDDGTATIISPKHVSLRQDDVARLQGQGIPVIPWTVNSPKDIRRLITWGVDGIISDYPDRVIEARQELAD